MKSTIEIPIKETAILAHLLSLLEHQGVWTHTTLEAGNWVVTLK